MILRRTILALTLALSISNTGWALDRTMYVINGLAETLSSVNLETNAVSNNITILGLVPNQIFIDNEGRRDTVGYIVNSISDDVQMVHLRTGTMLNSIFLGEGRNPWALAFVNDSVVVVSNVLTNTLAEVDTKNGTVLSEYPVGIAPEGMVYHNGLLYVCLTALDYNTFQYGQGQVAVVDLDADSVVAVVDVGQNPQALVVDYEGELLILCTGNYFSSFGMVYVVDPESFVVTDSIVTGGSPGHIQLAPNGLAYIAAGGWVTDGEVYLLDTHSHTMLRDAGDPVHVGTGAVAVASDINGMAYSCDFAVDQVSRIDGDSVSSTFLLGDGPGFAAIYEPFPPGDMNASGNVTSSDVIFVVNYIFKAGPAPASPALADMNKSCTISITDIITIVNFVFRNGAALKYGCY